MWSIKGPPTHHCAGRCSTLVWCIGGCAQGDARSPTINLDLPRVKVLMIKSLEAASDGALTSVDLEVILQDPLDSYEDDE